MKNAGMAAVYYKLGIRYFNLNRYKESEVAFNLALHIYPTYSAAWYYRGIVLE